MKNKLLIIGASGHGSVVANVAKEMNIWDQIEFLDDRDEIENPIGINIIGKSYEYRKFINDYDIFVAIGNNNIRKKIVESVLLEGANVPVLIHPSSIIGTEVEIGSGTVIMPGVIVNCSTIIGKGCIINTGATIDHDSLIEEYVHISPGVNLAGTVKVGKESWLGIGSVVSNNINITNNCTIGAGSVVIKDIIEPGIYVGVPVRRVVK